MEFIESEIIEFIEYIGFIKYGDRYAFKYVFDEMQFSITIMFRNGYVNIYNTTTYLGSFTELSQIIDILNDEKSFPSSNLIANIRKYKLNQIINTI